MSSKKKLIISLSVVAAVIVCAVIALVAVFAAGTATVSTNKVKITFSAENVYCDVRCDYTTANKSSLNVKTLTYSTQLGKTLNFKNDTTTGTLEPDTELEIKLNDSTASAVVFKYTFTNKNANKLKVVLNSALTSTNCAISYYDSEGSAITNVTANGITVAAKAAGASDDVTGVIYVVVAVDNVNLGVDFTYNAQWNLTAE